MLPLSRLTPAVVVLPALPSNPAATWKLLEGAAVGGLARGYAWKLSQRPCDDSNPQAPHAIPSQASQPVPLQLTLHPSRHARTASFPSASATDAARYFVRHTAAALHPSCTRPFSTGRSPDGHSHSTGPSPAPRDTHTSGSVSTHTSEGPITVTILSSSPSTPTSSPTGTGTSSHPTSSSSTNSLATASQVLAARVAQLSSKFNEVTGYNVIEQLKLEVERADDNLAAARAALRNAKHTYDAKLQEHGNLQQQQMSLLQRKGSWGSADVERFAALCREEHEAGVAVAQAKSAFGSAAEALESAHSEVLAAIRERYSAETLWSDKIRRASTWWTAGLMGLHLASFLTIYLVMEPLKARRLRNQVVDALRGAVEGLRSEVGEVGQGLRDLRGAVLLGPVPAGAPGEVPPAAAGGAGAGAAGVHGAGGGAEAGELRGQLARVEQRLEAVAAGVAAQGSAVQALATQLRERGLAGAPGTGTTHGSVGVETHGSVGEGARGSVGKMAGGARDGAGAEAGLEVGTGGLGGGLGTGTNGEVVDGLGWRRVVQRRAGRWWRWAEGRLAAAAESPAVVSGVSAFAGVVVGGLVLVALDRGR